MKQKKPKLLIWDVECTPLLGYAYGMWNTNILHVVEQAYIYSWSAKWYGQKKVIFRGVNEANEEEILKELHALLTEADISIAHNGDGFDIKMAKTRFAYYGLEPIPKNHTIDTLKILRREFRLPSNSLDNACRYFGLERKAPSDQKDWLLKMKAGDKKVWAKVKKYNVQDVLILEQLYEKIKPWVQNHPNLNLYMTEDGCPNCQSTSLQKRGFGTTRTGKYQRLQCQECGAWSRGKYQKVTDIR